LRKELNEGAWCPASPNNGSASHVYEWLEIDLGQLKVVTKVATQGRFGNGKGLEFAESYKLEYWRPGLDRFMRFKNRKGVELLPGNTNTYMPVEQEMDPPIVASRVRFVPFRRNLQICMRVEVYGCIWEGKSMRNLYISYLYMWIQRKDQE
ncbi:PREDICTED: discoidin domain-containing receptor A-like, partial [Priapulus caudatus]|uniref:Discoidin domain-containing receptor A-like n=1 Tax=Priapulus caudatus TaxID=37621 RepID=A0ABM1ETJ5_PRICU